MYTVVELGVSDSQLQTLLEGKKIVLEKSQFQGKVPLPLTKKQVASLSEAKRSITLKLSSRQLSYMQQHGEGWFKDRGMEALNFLKKKAKEALPVVKRYAQQGIHAAAATIPTSKLGPFQPIGDAGVRVGLKFADKLLDHIQEMFGGAAGVAAIDAQLGSGWFQEYLLPSVKTAADIAIPLIKGGASRREVHQAVDAQMGAGWFKDYLLPGVKTAADIAIPLLRGRGLAAEKEMTGEGIFSNIMRGLAGVAGMFGGGWTPMDKKKPSSGRGLVL